VSRDWAAEVSDPARVAALERTRLLDTPAEEPFDRLTRLSRELLDAPVALVSLVDRERQFFKSAFGLEEPWASRRETPLTHSFCKHVVAGNEPLVVADARVSPLVRDNLAVTELNVAAYAGVPLVSSGEAIGALCVIDHVPHTWTDADLRVLRGLGDAVEAQIALGRANAALVERERLLAAVLATMPAGVLLRHVDGAVIRTNPALERMLGRSAEELRTTDFWELTHPDDVAGDTESRDELLAGKRSVATRIKRYRHADGHYVWVRLSAAVWRDDEQRVQGTVAVIDDVTAERQAEEEVVRQARIYHSIARNIPRGAVLLFDHDMRYLAADGGELLASIGVDRGALVGRTVSEVATEEHRAPIEAAYRRALAGEALEYESMRLGRALRTRIAPVREGDVIAGGIALVQDVTEERERAEELRRSRQLFEATISNLSDAVVVFEASNQALYANRAYAELWGFGETTLAGMSREQFLAQAEKLVEDPLAFRALIERAAPESADAKVEVTLVRPRRRHLRRTVVAVNLPTGAGRVAIWQDITAERELLAEREQQALMDSLTGIPNRRAAEQELSKALARSDRALTPLSVVLFDVDHFKHVNDRHGHAQGDEVLRRVAATLDRAKRLTDTVARWGGEEFVAVLPVALEGAGVFGERVRAEVAEMPCPGVGGVTISAGVAERREGETADALLRRADERLYRAKAEGRNRVCAS